MIFPIVTPQAVHKFLPFLLVDNFSSTSGKVRNILKQYIMMSDGIQTKIGHLKNKEK